MRIVENVFSFRRNWPAWLLLGVSLFVTAWATYSRTLDSNADVRRDFEYACDEIKWRIDARMKAHAQILRSSAALFHSSKEVTRSEWKAFTVEQKVEQHLPGIQGIGFAKLIQRESLAAFTETVRAEGFPDFEVTPPGERSVYTSIVYLEPFDARNRRAFGYDMYSEPVRRAAMEQARDDNVAALSGRVTLLQETNTDIQAGTLMYVPVYKRGMRLDSVEHRREALFGWVYSPFRMKDLMNGILRGKDEQASHGIRLQVYDREDLGAPSLMYDSAPSPRNSAENFSNMTHVVRMSFNNHPWYLRFFRFQLKPVHRLVLNVALSGTAISLLLFGMISMLQIARRKAQQLAEQLKVESRLEAINQQLQKNESLHRMAGAIAHHFNNKLGAVMGNIDLALEELPGSSPARAMLDAAMSAASGAAEISGQMLTYLGQSSRVRIPDKLSRIVNDAMPLLRTIVPKQIELEINLPAEGPTVLVDRSQIQQVLTNLATNSFEAADKKQGRVTISIKETSASDLPAENRFPVDWRPESCAYASLEVADTGVGIAKSDFNKLFDPFYSSRFTGRGLGLAAVLGIARAHGGAVAVESVQGVGSLFRVFLPISEQKTVVPSAESPKNAPIDIPVSETGNTVLLVEDEAPLREMAETMLTGLGYRVVSAGDGAEAVQVFRKHINEIQVVLCDLTMPRLNGWETLEALRSIRPNIPVVLTSGHAESHAMAGRQKEDPLLFLHKPYRKEQLQSALRRAVQTDSVTTETVN